MASVNTGPSEAVTAEVQAIARNWWLLLFFGIISVIVGIFCVVHGFQTTVDLEPDFSTRIVRFSFSSRISTAAVLLG